MKSTLRKKHFTVASAAALLITGCASSSNESVSSFEADMGQCHGVNSCKGTGSCAISGQNSCASQNSCKGKGWIPLMKGECNERNGKFVGFKKTS